MRGRQRTISGGLTISCVLTIACATTGGSSPEDTLAYVVPSPATAVYEIVDTAAVYVNSPVGALDIPTNSATTLSMTFEMDPRGVRATGSVESFEASMSNPMQGTLSADLGDVTGHLEMVFGRRGVEEVVSVPAVAGPAAQLAPFHHIANDLFPRLPAGAVDPGATWVDTVTWTIGDGTIETNSTTVYTHTLVGDTVVDGRTLRHIAVAGDVANDAEVLQAGTTITQSMTGSTTGFVLWDAERGLLAEAFFERELEGSMTMPGMAPFNMGLEGPVRVRLRN